MKDSIIRWVAIFALLAVIAVAAIFAIDDDEVTVQAIQDRSQILENETLNSNKKVNSCILQSLRHPCQLKSGKKILKELLHISIL